MPVDALGNDPVGFELNVLIGRLEALVAVLASAPDLGKTVDFDKAREFVRNSPAIQRAPKTHKGTPNDRVALDIALETIKKIEGGVSA